jgi:hypothetical protein
MEDLALGMAAKLHAKLNHHHVMTACGKMEV